jgi:serine/threonine-protein kinase
LRDVFREKSLKLSEILDISIQIANALCAAHEAHIIHRDIKPENVMIRPDGFAKILDFGLAKLVERKDKSIFNLKGSTLNQTAKGIILGTVNYMSPEQAKAERVDGRSDIFSFGVLIYEMIVGRTPFAGDSNSETFANLINSEPKDFDSHASNIPEEMRQMIFKMLSKDPNDRYQAMNDVLTELKKLKANLALDARMEHSYSLAASETSVLRGTTGGGEKKSTAESFRAFSQSIKRHKPLAASVLAALLFGAVGLGYYFLFAGKTALGADGKKSIAVLPLKPINTANRDEIYEFGIADSLIHRLGSMKGLTVRPLSATRKYADIAQDPIAAGQEQKVDYVLASNYQLADGRIRITAQLFNVASGQIEETYKSEKDFTNIFAMQDAIAGEVGNILQARFSTTSTSPKAVRGTDNEEAYRLYLQGKYIHTHGTQATIIDAFEVFEQAVRLDPNYAQAWASKATAHQFSARFGRSINIHEHYQKSLEAINKALALDANLSEAHAALCGYKLKYEWNFAEAESECRLAIELDPNSSSAHQVYADYLSIHGRFDESIAEMKIAKDLEPVSISGEMDDGIKFEHARRYDEAVAIYKRVVEMNEDYGNSYPFLWHTLSLQGKYDEAFEWYMKAPWLRDEDADKEYVQSLRKIYKESGWKGIEQEWVSLIEKDFQAYYWVAGFNAELGNKDKAFEYLEKAFERREYRLVYLQVDPFFDSLRDDPRFEDLLRRVGLK